jgi:nicotinate-nucleotide pyrophosphorylase
MNSFDIALSNLVNQAIKEDIGSGDHSTLSCIPPTQKGKAVLKIKEGGILAGIEVAKKIFNQLEPESCLTAFKKGTITHSSINKLEIRNFHLIQKKSFFPKFSTLIGFPKHRVEIELKM